jgi:uncharacterized OB-fold protein
MEYSFYKHKIVGGIGADDKYWEGLEEGEFRLPRCADCKKWMWPAHWRCAKCGSWEQEWVKLDPVGTVFSWTRTWYAFDRVKERAGDIPYVVVLAEIPASDGARVLGVLKGSEEGLKIGAPVRGSIDPPSEKSKGYAAIRWSLSS